MTLPKDDCQSDSKDQISEFFIGMKIDFVPLKVISLVKISWYHQNEMPCVARKFPGQSRMVDRTARLTPLLGNGQ